MVGNTFHSVYCLRGFLLGQLFLGRLINVIAVINRIHKPRMMDVSWGPVEEGGTVTKIY